MVKEAITFGYIEIEKHKSHNYSFLEYVAFENVISSGEKNYKYFIGYLHDDYKIKPLQTMLLKQAPM